MKQFKNLIRLSLMIIIMASFAAIGLNFFLVPKIQAYSEINRNIVDESMVAHAKLSLPVAVMKNIHGQVVDKSTPLNTALEEAYLRNAGIIEDATDNLEDAYVALKENLDTIQKLSLRRHDTNVSEIEGILEELNITVRAIEDTVGTDSIETLSPERLHSLYDTQGTQLKELVFYEKALENQMVRDVALIVNIVVTLLILLLILLGFILMRYVDRDFRFMMQGLSVISNRTYDRSTLPKIKPYFDEEVKMVAVFSNVIEERRFSKEIRDIVSKCYIVDDVIEVLFSKLQEKMPIDRLGIAFVDYNKGKIIAEHSTVKSGRLYLSAGFEQSIDTTSLKEIIRTGRPAMEEDLSLAYDRKPKSPTLGLLRKEGMNSNMVIPLKMGQAVFGMLFFSSTEAGFFSEAELRTGEAIVDEIAPLLNRAYFTKIILTKITTSFSTLVEGKDTSTGEHIERMVRYCVLLAKGIKRKRKVGYELTERDILDLERHASSHDIGKVAIPDAILKKPGKLTPEEWVIMKTHTTVGANIFQDLREGLMMFDPEFFKTAENIARSHHEKWDGSGYPIGLRGESIPLVGRIVAIADVFDALTSKRVYKDAFSFEKAVNIIKEGAGAHFDPFLVEVFLENLPAFEAVYNA